MRSVALLCMLLLCATAARAQPADPVLQAISERLERPAVVRGEFVQTRHIAGLVRPLVARGRFVVARGEGVLWDTLEPFPQQLRIDRDGLRTADPDGGSTLVGGVRGPALRELGRLLGAVFEADLAVLDEYFVARGEFAGTQWQVVLEPRAAALGRVFAGIALHGDGLVRAIELREANGDSTAIRFEAMHTDTALTRDERDALVR